MMNHLRIEFGFGCQFDKDQHGLQRDHVLNALKIIKKEAGQLFGSYTVVPTYGGWTNSIGRLVEEDGFTLFTVQDTPKCFKQDMLPKIEELREVIKKQLNQEAVAITVYDVFFSVE